VVSSVLVDEAEQIVAARATGPRRRYGLDMPERISEAVFPDSAGVYVVYKDAEALYVGVAATQTLAARWRRQHLRPRAGGSALRRTLGVHLGLVDSKLRTSDGRYYPPAVEEAITLFLTNCEIEFHPTVDAASARALEHRLIGELRPTLNVRRGTVEARAKRALAAGLSAVEPDVVVDHRGYVRDLDDNLVGVSRAEIEREFAAGAGNELAGKMLAPWSSSALAANSFARWRPCADALKLAGISGFRSFAFERKCDHGVRGEWPNLDVVLERDRAVVGVESKCLEYTRAHKPVVVSDAYWALRDTRAESRWFAALSEVAGFARLDAYQLVKHFLGLAYSYPDRERTLVYLYWEPLNSDEPLFVEHRREVARFAALVADDPSCGFVALSYAEHWRELDALDSSPAWLAAHLDVLRRRYAVTI
jgi:hypothetical protein